MSTFSNASELSLHSNSNDKRKGIGRGLSLSHPAQKRFVGRTFCSAGVCTYPTDTIESHSHTTDEKIGVVLLNLGGPDTLQDVQPFLFNLFADPVCFIANNAYKFI